MKAIMILFCVLLPLTLTALIPFGPATSQIGREVGDGDDWMPLFFALGEDGAIHVPDFYKGRMALFDAGGKFLKAIPTEAGLIPSLNYFARSPQGYYVLFSNFTLWVLDAGGKLKGKFAFPMGFFPEGFFVNERGVALKHQNRGYAFDWDKLSLEPRVSGEKRGSKTVAVIDLGIKAAFSLGDQILLQGWKSPELEAAKGAFLARHNPDGRTYWGLRDNGGWRTWEISGQGKLLKTTYYGFNPRDKLSFTLVCGANGKWTGGSVTDTEFLIKSWE